MAEAEAEGVTGPVGPAGHAGLHAADVLARAGTEAVFTLSGGHVFPLYDGCVRRGIRLVDTRHEQTAVFAAEGWSKVTRRTGVAALTAGPGVTNGISAVAAAWMNGSPLLVLGGRAPAARWGSGSLQELDHVPLLAPVTRHAATVAAVADVPAEVAAALATAATPHRGPVFLDVPMDVLFASGDAVPADPPAPPPAADPDPEALARVAGLLRAASRPVLVVGGDAYWAHAEEALRHLAEAARLPVVANGMGRGLLPADHELAVSRARPRALREADLVVVAGTPLDFRLGFGRFGAADVVHLCDAPDVVGHHAAPAAWTVGDLRATFEGLAGSAGLAAAGRAARSAWVGALRDEERARRAAETGVLGSAARPIHPARVHGELRARLARDAVVVGDGGDFVSYAGRYVDSYAPGCFLDPGPFGCLGMGPGYALAAALARPGHQVVLLLGDGAAGFSLGDWDTLVRFGVDVVVVIGNNGIWGLEKHPMRAVYGYDVAAELRPGTRYDQVAVALGGHGELVDDPEDVGPALDRAFAAGGLAVVNVCTDPADAYPRSAALG